jgi:beta-lactamase regulating signal transducer with metallopeptidase domain
MSLALWMRWLGWLAAETTALVAGAAILHLWLRSPRAGRTIWRAALTAVALVWMVELSGLRERMPRPELRRHRFVIMTTMLTPSAQPITPATEWQRPMRERQSNNLSWSPAAEPKNSGETPLPLWIWLGGSMLLLARICLARLWLARRRRASAPADEDSLGLIARWQTSFGLRRIESKVWAGLRGPVAFGVLRPAIALPPDFTARFSCAEREAMLAHEMAHLAAHDPFWWMVSDAVTALAWWHPLVWWARRQLQSAHEAAADEASALIPGGARTLAECLVRLGRELTAPDAARALGIGGNGPRSQLAARIERLLREPRAWRPLSVWARWLPQFSAMLVALASAFLPIQTGLSGSILAVLASAAPARAEVPASTPVPVPITNHAPAAVPPSTPFLSLATNEPEPFSPDVTSQSKPVPIVPDLASLTPVETPTNPTPIVIPIVPVTQIALKDGNANPPSQVSLIVRFVELPENVSDGLGLDWVFGLEPTNNPVMEISHDWGFGVTPVDMSLLQTKNGQPLRAGWDAPPKPSFSHPENLVIEHLRADGQSAVLKPEQFAALLKRIENPGEADILVAPQSGALSGLKAHLACQGLMTCVTGVTATTGPANDSPLINYRTDNLALGIAVDVIPKLEDNGKWRLQVRASHTAFIGYDNHGKNYASISIPGGKPLGYDIPHPHFRALEADADESVLLGQTLALRGPLWSETTKTKGHFLVPGKSKTVRQRLYIFVTPTLPSPSDKKKI